MNKLEALQAYAAIGAFLDKAQDILIGIDGTPAIAVEGSVTLGDKDRPFKTYVMALRCDDNLPEWIHIKAAELHAAIEEWSLGNVGMTFGGEVEE
ncbi:MAG: hypothetical protein AAGD09_11420 [Cyanobacteria bacterium P01_F01_bin.56]